MEKYDVIIVGAGPAGIFSAIKLAERGVKHVLMVEQGPDIYERRRGRGADMLMGWGGAGAFSDGKLTFSKDVGGALVEYVGEERLEALFNEVDRIYRENGAESPVYGEYCEELEQLEIDARLAGMEFVQTRIRHIGTENCINVLKNMRTKLEGRVEVRPRTKVSSIVVEGGRAKGVLLADGDEICSQVVIVAPGRSGNMWLDKEARKLGLTIRSSPVDIGVRVEAPSIVLKRLTDVAYEAKLIYYSRTFDDKVRTFCMNPYGEVIKEEIDGLVTVNGHSYASRRTGNTNFAILVSSSFTEPFDDPNGYGRYIARLANVLGNGVIVQRLGDLIAGRRSTSRRLKKCVTKPTLRDATPGDLSFVLPYRHLRDIMEMLEAMDKVVPGIYSHSTLVYGVEVKFYSQRVKLSDRLESEVENLFIIGDGSGVTRGLLQASASGLVAGDEAASRVL